MSKVYEELEAALVAAGVPAGTTKDVKGCSLAIKGAVSVLVNTRLDAEPYAQILLKFAPRLADPGEITMVARCMSQPRGFREATPWLLSLLAGFPGNGLGENHLWAVGNAIYTIDNRQFYADVASICGNSKYGSSRQMLMGALARARTDEAYRILVECLGDPSVRAHAIEALGRFGRIDAIRILEPLVVQKGLYEYKAKETALRRLRRKQEKGLLPRQGAQS
jgi:hypothetical protein